MPAVIGIASVVVTILRWRTELAAVRKRQSSPNKGRSVQQAAASR